MRNQCKTTLAGRRSSAECLGCTVVTRGTSPSPASLASSSPQPRLRTHRRTPRLTYSMLVFGHAALRPPARPSVLAPTSSQPQLFSHSPVRSSALVSVDDLARGPSGDSFPGSKPPRSRNRLSTPNMLCVPSVRPAIHSISDAPGVNGEPTSGRRDRELVDHLIAAT